MDDRQGLGVLRSAFERARAGDWAAAQAICAAAGNGSPALASVARLDILICQYHLGFPQLIPERALPLLATLPAAAWAACVGLSLLAARKTGVLGDYRHLLLALASPRFGAFDLPTVPTFVMLEPDMSTCSVVESHDAALMSEIVLSALDAPGLADHERAALQSLAARYRERTSRTAAQQLAPPVAAAPSKRPWWKR